MSVKKSSNKKTVLSKKKAVTRPPRQSAFQLFRDAYLSEIPDEDLTDIDFKNLEDLIKRQFDNAQKYTKFRFQVEVENPDGKWGWKTNNTIISVIFEDMAFVIDSVTSVLTDAGFTIKNTFHPLLYISRDKTGKPEQVSVERGEGLSGEGYLYIELTRRLTPQQMKALKSRLEEVLADVRRATRDWRTMKQKVREAQQGLKTEPDLDFDDLQEYLEFLNYVHDDNFTLLGYKYYRATKKGGKIVMVPDQQSGLGLLSPTRPASFLNGEEASLFESNDVKAALPPVFISKLAILSPVHRSVPIDSILVRQFDRQGNLTGEVLLLGLFTSVTYSRGLRGVPLLRHKGNKIMQQAEFDPNSHNERALRHIIEKFPRDEFMQSEIDQLYNVSMSILRLKERPRIALFLREDPFGRTLSALIYIPRDRYDTRLRLKFQQILEEELEASCTNYTSTVDDSPLVRIIYNLTWAHGERTEFDASQIEARLQEAGRSWNERLFGAFMEKYKNHDDAASISTKYDTAFPVGYQEKYTAHQGRHDITKLEKVLKTRETEVDLFKPNGTTDRQFSLKLFIPATTLALSEILPVLENMGLKVIAEYPFEIRVENQSVWIQDLFIEIPSALAHLDVAAVKADFESCLKQIWSGEVEDDSLNKLVLLAGLDARRIAILRTYARYLRQTKIPFSLQYIEQALTDYPTIAKSLVNLFEAHFDPAQKTKTNPAALLKNIELQMADVKALDQDRILRSMLALVSATLRTNFYQDKAWISVKFDSSRAPELPDPRPYREIFVYSPRVEGVHLRGDIIARGGLRWSDRNEDFRTEVLGLMKAQQVKNAIIIPMGAKGGFIVKRPPETRAAFLDEGKECYRTFIRGLLDITDNQKDGKIIPPKNVRRLDGDDSYLVVAADKGTATFSDIANALSAEYNFWLGDAFASGGSHGYDHKDMGITARGAWESVKRHFHELGTDVQKDTFDIIGVGDMGGDVFGNGLLRTKSARLIGAFNHIHIFCDPNPDPASSFRERERLFGEVKGWDHYDQKKLSKGGRIFNRSDKSLKLTPEIQKAFGITKSEVPPNDLIRAMLTAKTDLMFFGGIGTYVKSSRETNLDAGDRSNDALRINGSELLARVVGEGANLGMTQRGRIEYAENGGRLNTDFIDNSAGVDTSDHEVNIKILLTDVMGKKNARMDEKIRDKLLSSMTEEVEQLVLRDNYQQAQALSVITRTSAQDLDKYIQLMNLLERDGLLKRDVEFLPDDETLEKRRAKGMGLTRPELCVLFSYSKIAYTKELIDGAIPDDKAMLDWAVRYFPKAMQSKFGNEIKNHRLKRNIIATMISNAIINRLGPCFVRLAMEETGKDADTITLALLKIREKFGLRDLWDSIENLGSKIPAESALMAFTDIADTAEYLALTMLAGKKAKDAVRPATRTAKEWTTAGFPAPIAQKLGSLSELSAT